MTTLSTTKKGRTNDIGLTKNDYLAGHSTLCAGCGHNSITTQIVDACYELNLVPEDLLKFSGIGCSSKSPAYFLSRTHGFNSLHGRMPSIATGAAFGDHTLKPIAISGDGDSASIGMGQFKNVIRRNLNMVYIIANNGVYGLTKGQFSATAEEGLTLRHQGKNHHMPVDICMEAIASNATFVARSFAGDAKQVKTLIKAAIKHNGIAVIDIISPCVAFNNQNTSHHSYNWGKQYETPIHGLDFIPFQEEIMIEDTFRPGESKRVTLHDGSVLVLKKLSTDYDPTSRSEALRLLGEASKNDVLLTGLIYISPEVPSLTDIYDLTDIPLNRLEENQLKPSKEKFNQMMSTMFLGK